jgi:hypothetical protein
MTEYGHNFDAASAGGTGTETLKTVWRISGLKKPLVDGVAVR